MNTAVRSTLSPVSTFTQMGSASSAGTVAAPHMRAGLERHVQHCARARGPWFALGRAAESVHAAISPRFFTTIVVASALICLVVEWV